MRRRYNTVESVTCRRNQIQTDDVDQFFELIIRGDSPIWVWWFWSSSTG